MKEQKRNLAVGVFVLLGALGLAALILAFSNIATIFKVGYVINAEMEHASGMTPGRVVHFRGLRVGEVEEVYYNPERQLVMARVRIRDDDLLIPAGAVMFTAPATFGEVFIDIRIPEDREAMPGYLAQDGSAVIPGRASPPQFIPEELVTKLEGALEGFGRTDKLVENLIQLTEPRRLAEVEQGTKPPNVSSTLERIDDAVARVASEENLENLSAALKSVQVATARLERTMAETDRLVAQVSRMTATATEAVVDVQRRSAILLDQATEDAKMLERVLGGVNDLVAGVQRGEGTLGQLLRSDRAYRELELTLVQARQALRDFSRLMTKLEEEGLLRRGG